MLTASTPSGWANHKVKVHQMCEHQNLMDGFQSVRQSILYGLLSVRPTTAVLICSASLIYVCTSNLHFLQKEEESWIFNTEDLTLSKIYRSPYTHHIGIPLVDGLWGVIRHTLRFSRTWLYISLNAFLNRPSRTSSGPLPVDCDGLQELGSRDQKLMVWLAERLILTKQGITELEKRDKFWRNLVRAFG